MAPPRINVKALQLSVEGLYKLLGGSDEDKQRFWERLKGITTPREAILLNSQIDGMAGALNSVKDAAKGLQNAAKQKM